MSHPIGLSFGLEYITVCKAGEDDTVETMGSRATSSAYQEFFQRVLGGRVQGNLDTRPGEAVPKTHLIPPKSDNVEGLLRRELEEVLAWIKGHLNDAAEVVPAICVPYHWSETVQRADFKAAEGAKMPLAGIHVLLRLPRALEWAYRLDSDVSVDDYFFIVVDYNRKYLHLHICETAKNGAYGIVEGQAQLSHLGETSVSGIESRGEVIGSIRRFLSLTMARGDSAGGKISDEEIRAIILSGDASSEGMQEMRNILQHVFGQMLLCDSHLPFYAAAVGAARAAKLQVEDPKSTKDFVSAPDNIPGEPKPS